MKLIAVGGRVILEPIEENQEIKTAGGIIIPDNSPSKSMFVGNKAKVLMIGLEHESGEPIKTAFKEGDIIYYDARSVIRMKLNEMDGKEILLIALSNIFCIAE